MQTATLFQGTAKDLAEEIVKAMPLNIRALQTEAPINPNDVPDQSATQAAKYLRCSPAHLVTLVGKYPEHLRPIVEEGKAVRYKFAQLHYLKSNNLVK